ncbi:MAG TPA: hypothetical protein VGQ76_21220 [Thermoanaerobaculia bacterium]|jgi:hypothetical protein|nr:hypothetical protein [Thermoanaerobaculia bacterium]
MRSVSTKRRALLLAFLIILTITPLSADPGVPPTTLEARIKPPIGNQSMELDPEPSLFDMFIVWWQMNVFSPLG